MVWVARPTLQSAPVPIALYPDWVGGVIFLRFYEVKTINNLILVEEKTLLVERKKKLSLNPFLYFPKRIYT